MRSRKDGWMVTKAAAPSGNSNMRPRSLVTVTGRPNRLRAAVAPSATMTARLHHRPFKVEPDLAALDFVGVGTFVQAPLAAHLMLEMLHGVGDEDLRARDLRLRQGVVEDLASGADERLAGEIFLVAGLLAHQHELSAPASLARDGLDCVLIERTTGARVLGLGQLRQRPDGRNDIELELGRPRHRGTPKRRYLTINARSRRRFERPRRGPYQST